MLERLSQDLRHALRSLRSSPGFTAVAVLTLALGIGANTAIFTVLDAVLLAPLPYAEADRVVMVWSGWNNQPETWVSEPEVEDFRQAAAIEELAAFTYRSVILTGDGTPSRLRAGTVEAELFDILGAEPLLGRTFTPAEDVPGQRVVVLDHGLWQERFGGDPEVVGHTVLLNQEAWKVVGVMPPEFRLPLDFAGGGEPAMWMPLALDTIDPESRGGHYLYTVGKLAPGATADLANQQLAAITARLTQEGLYSPESGFRATAKPVEEQILGDVRPVLLVLAGAVGFVLLIACVNVANLMLARGQARGRELAVRRALGASSRRIFGLLFTESLLLAVVGGLLGIGVAWASLEAIAALDPASVPRFAGAGLSAPVLGLNLALALLAGVAFGVAPALRSARPDLGEGLREGSRGAGSSRRTERLRQGLVVSQVAFAVLLVVGAALMLRTFWNLTSIDVGFDTDDVLSLQIYLPEAEYGTDAEVLGFFQRVVHRVRRIPGVEHAGLGRSRPLDSTIGDWTISLDGRTPPPGTDFDGDWQVAGPGYFEAMGMRLIEGRILEETDRADSPPVMVINRRMAEEYWPDESALGQRIKLGGPDSERPWASVVGVVDNLRHNSLTDLPNRKFYAPWAQWPVISGGAARRSLYLTVKAANEPLGLVSPIRAAVSELDPAIPLSSIRTYDDIRAGALSQSRLVMALLTGFAGLALLLAAIGVYGVVAYAVAQRIPEFGVRVALGASAGDVARLVLGKGILVTLLGVALGAGAALFLTRLLASMLYGVEPVDPLSFAAVPAVLLATSAVACLLPALRAARVEPVEALRTD